MSFWTGSNLASAGLSQGVINQLQPFLANIVVIPGTGGLSSFPITVRGPKGAAAQALLTALPINPVLPSTNVANLFSYAYGIFQSRALTGFENLTGSLFLQLPAAAQSVLTDLAFNYGNLGALPSSMQQAIANQDWATLATLIQQNIPGPRGVNDAAALQNAIANGVLASKGTCS